MTVLMENIRNSNQIIPQIIRVVGFALLFAAFYLLLQRIDVYLQTQAVKECGQTSRFIQEIPAQNARAEYPVADVYEACLRRIDAAAR